MVKCNNLRRPVFKGIAIIMSFDDVYCNMSCPLVMSYCDLPYLLVMCIAICHVHWSCILQSAMSISYVYCNLSSPLLMCIVMSCTEVTYIITL